MMSKHTRTQLKTPLPTVTPVGIGLHSQPSEATPPQEHSAPDLETARRLGHRLGAVRVNHSATPIVQPKLKLDLVNDRYELEADRVAARVVPQISISSASREGTEKVQRKPAIQRVSAPPAAAPTVTPEVQAGINAARGGGQPLLDSVRGRMEKVLGADFSGVRVHTDAQSHQLNQAVEARAFTTGQDIFFRQGEYQPGSDAGRRLLAHELAHVVQQRPGKEPVSQGENVWVQRNPGRLQELGKLVAPDPQPRRELQRRYKELGEQESMLNREINKRQQELEVLNSPGQRGFSAGLSAGIEHQDLPAFLNVGIEQYTAYIERRREEVSTELLQANNQKGKLEGQKFEVERLLRTTQKPELRY